MSIQIPEFHPMAEKYRLDQDCIDEMTEDMKANGFDSRYPVLMFEKKVLEGRQRCLAAKQADVEPVYRNFQGSADDAVAFVHRVNDIRRHMTPEELAEKREDRIKAAFAMRTGANGQEAATLQEIADKLRVSKTMAKRYCETAERDPARYAPPVVHQCTTEESTNGDGVATVVPDLAPPKVPERVKGKGGKSYKTKKPRKQREAVVRKPTTKELKKKAEEGYGIMIRAMDELGIFKSHEKPCQKIKDAILAVED